MMSGIRRKDTSPELWVRRHLFHDGFRFRTDVKALPGTPDIKLTRYKAVVFVHGCFWHGHDCHYFHMPSTRTEFWSTKIEKNRQRDAVVLEHLASLGWRVAVVWECAIRHAQHAKKLNQDKPLFVITLEAWLKGNDTFIEISELTTNKREPVIGGKQEIIYTNNESCTLCIAESPPGTSTAVK